MCLFCKLAFTSALIVFWAEVALLAIYVVLIFLDLYRILRHEYILTPAQRNNADVIIQLGNSIITIYYKAHKKWSEGENYISS